MTKIDHTALYVRDLEAVRRFFETYFAVVSSERYHNGAKGFTSYFLTFPQGGRLELMHLEKLAENGAEPHLGYAHLAVGIGSCEAVDDLTARLAADGYEVVSRPRNTGDGYYESCVRSDEGFLLEITV